MASFRWGQNGVRVVFSPVPLSIQIAEPADRIDGRGPAARNNCKGSPLARLPRVRLKPSARCARDRREIVKTIWLALVLTTAPLYGQLEGLWQGYPGEWGHVTRKLIALAEATPAEKFAWRPAPGVR